MRFMSFEPIIVLVLVVAVNLLIKMLLNRLHRRFEHDQKIWQDSLVCALYRPLSYYIWCIAIADSVDLISIHMGFPLFGEGTMRAIITFGAILALAWFLLRWKHNMVAAMIQRSKLNKDAGYDQGRIDVMGKLATLVILLVTMMLLMEASGHSLQTLIAFGGISGLAIAFASQEIIANFFSGLVIYMTRPFGIGDWIIIPEKGIEGQVEEIGWYTTCVRTFDKRPVYVPNSIFSKLVVMTPSRMSHRQIKETIGIRYRDKDKLQRIIQALKMFCGQHPNIDPTCRTAIHFTAYGDGGLQILIECYTLLVDAALFADFKQEFLLQVGKIIEENGAEMAFPATIVEVPDGLALRLEES